MNGSSSTFRRRVQNRREAHRKHPAIAEIKAECSSEKWCPLEDSNF